jgi:hypothetical protein
VKTEMTIEEARKEYKDMKKMGLHHGAQALRDQFLFWYSVDIAA